MGALLEISRVSQSFRSGFWLKRTEILHDITFNVPERTVFGFLGANGAGKTTLIHLIAGIRRPFAGTVRIRGDEAHSVRARSRLGYLPERPYFYDHLTGEGLLRYFGALSGMRRRAIDGRIPRVLAAVGMERARKLELRKYSKGMLQRIGIAQALLHDPEFLVLDEPMSGLDPVGRKEIRELILGLSSEGRTVFFSTHIIPDVEAVCDQVALIQRGRLIGAGALDEFVAKGAPARTEIVFTGSGAEGLRSLAGVVSLQPVPGGGKALVEGAEAATRALRELLGGGAAIRSVNPVRPSLEELFSDA
jgi:ABC-2 type transport system ATP-binding protein